MSDKEYVYYSLRDETIFILNYSPWWEKELGSKFQNAFIYIGKV